MLDGMQRISVSSDGNWVSGFSPTNSTNLWIVSVTGGKRVGPMVHTQTIWDISFSPDARRLVSLSHDTAAHIWDVSTGAPIGEALRHDLHASSAVFSPDSRRVATTGSDKLAKIWNASDGRPIHSELRHAAEVRFAVFSLDARLLATVCEDRTVTIWNADTGLPIAVLAHSAPISAAAFSPDGIRLATASDDNSVRVWDVQTGLPLSEPLVHPGKIATLSFSPEGNAILTACADGVCRVWPIPILVDPVPRWMPELAEFLAGQKLETNAVVQPIQRETIDAWLSRLDKDSFEGPFARWMERFQR